MTTASLADKAPDLSFSSYVVIGLATCYVRDEDEIKEITVVEPIPSAYLEALFKGVPTAYYKIYGTTLGGLLNAGENAIELPSEVTAEASLCSDFSERLFAAARTFKARTSAQELVPVGDSHSDLNYSTEKKRILNMENIVSAEDNVKQHEYTHRTL